MRTKDFKHPCSPQADREPRPPPGRINAGSNPYHESSPSVAVREEIDLRFSDFVKGTRFE